MQLAELKPQPKTATQNMDLNEIEAESGPLITFGKLMRTAF